MNPFPRSFDKIEVQVKEEMRKRGRIVRVQGVENERAIRRRHVEEQLERLHPGLVDFGAALLFAAVAQVQAYIADQLLGIAIRNGILQILQ